MTKILALLGGKNLLSFICMFLSVLILVNGINYLAVHVFQLHLNGWQQFLWAYILQSIILGLSVYFWFYRRFPHDRGKISWKVNSIFQLIGYVLLIFVCYFLFVAGLYLVQKLLNLNNIPGIGEQISIISLVGDGVGLWIAFVVAVVVAPTVEEYVFRGWGMICLPLETHPYLAILLNGLVFALCHLELSVILPLTFLGIMIAWVRYKSGSILPGIVFHLINNSLALFADYAMHNHLLK